MTINKLYKYSTLLLLFMTSGILFFVVAPIDNINFRYKIFDIFQFGSSKIFNLVDWKFHTNKDNTILASYFQIAPLVNILASIIWTGLFLLLLRVFKKQNDNAIKVSNFWKQVFYTNLTLSLLFFIIWLCTDLDFMYEGIYSTTTSFIRTVYDWFSFIVFIPSAIPILFASVVLDQGGDTAHGYDDMYLVTKTETAFALTFWALLGVYVYNKIKKRRATKRIKTTLITENASS